jgi:hypothetical protein
MALHAILIGFVLSMVFGHALIILPAVARLRVRYGSPLYGPLILLHMSLVLRVGSGLIDWPAGRQWSGIATIAAILSFVVTVAWVSKARSGSGRGSKFNIA